MELKYRQLLESCDEEGAYEIPEGFNYGQLERDALLVRDELKARLALETKFEDGVHNQDASFSIAIILLDYVERRKNGIYQPTIRFSNFGRLTTLTFVEMLPSVLVHKIRSALGKHRFHYVPVHALETEYDGVMAGDKTFPSWWVRYFDWL